MKINLNKYNFTKGKKVKFPHKFRRLKMQTKKIPQKLEEIKIAHAGFDYRWGATSEDPPYYYKLSPSRINSYIQCPQRFAFDYALPPSKKREVVAIMEISSYSHDYVARATIGPNKEMLLDIDQIKHGLEQVFTKFAAKDSPWSFIMALAACQKHCEWAYERELYNANAEFAVKESIEAIPFYGIVDLAPYTEEGLILATKLKKQEIETTNSELRTATKPVYKGIIDWKFKTRNLVKEPDYFHLMQAGLYVLCLQDLLVEPYISTLVYIGPNKKKEIEVLPFSTIWTQEKLNYLASEVKKVNSGIDNNIFTPNPGFKWCTERFCRYWDNCPKSIF